MVVETDGWANLEKPLGIHFSLRSVLDRVAPLIAFLCCDIQCPESIDYPFDP